MRFCFIALFILLFCIPLHSQSVKAEVIERKTDIYIQGNTLVTKEYKKILINQRDEETRFTDVEIIHQKTLVGI